jgi:DNA-binding transcriptional LysR family regulator
MDIHACYLQKLCRLAHATMNLDPLKTLVAVAEHGSFVAAARVLDLSQSAVSLHIQTLEQALGRPMFDRSTKPPTLTPDGMASVARAKDLLLLAAQFIAPANPASGVEGRLTLGAVGSVLTGILPIALAAIRSRHANLHLEIISGQSSQLRAMVERRRLDAAIVSDYDGDEASIEWRPFLREALIMIAPPESTGTDIHRLGRLYPFIRYSPGAAVGRVIDRAIGHLRLDVREGMRLDWLEAIEAMVRRGHGIAIVPERLSAPPLGVRRIALGDGSYHRMLGLIEATRHRKRRLTDTVVAELRSGATPETIKTRAR